MDSSRKSRRERLIANAMRLRLSFSPDITEDGLRRLIDAAPAADRQLLILDDFLRPFGREVPQGLTYGQARKAIEASMELVNERAIESLKLVEGAIREWAGKYYYVVRVYGSNYGYRVALRQVVLSRPVGSSKAQFKAASTKNIKVHPVNLLFVSVAVDLAAWQPTMNFRSRIDPDEPLF